ncbi:periplasmic heavy metal sensor [Aromatoleum sp.]|uniref:periplasmic heavy metal sensor n=1 Tax=Aromatoleum sp. TaxID=2307007 RepID=UPI002FCC9643
MKPTLLRVALLVSLFVNVGVVVAVGMNAFRAPASQDGAPLHEYLGLDADQTRRWHEIERPFVQQFGAASAEVERHRVALIGAIFAEDVDRAKLEAERDAIARVQAEQQRLLIEQLLAEREILAPTQRVRLAQLLLDQPGGSSAFEKLHSR